MAHFVNNFCIGNLAPINYLIGVPKTRATTLDSERLRVLGATLRSARENLRYSYRELAQLSGVSASQLLRIESGEFDFSLCKFLRVVESLGLSVGIVLENAMFRRFPRPEFGKLDEVQMLAFIDRIAPAENESKAYDKYLAVRELVMGAAEITAAVILAVDPSGIVFHIQHPFTSINRRIEDFAHHLSPMLQHYERAAMLKALCEDPFAKLRSLEILTDEVVLEYLQWFATHRGAFNAPRIGWAAAHVIRPKPLKAPPGSKRRKK